MVVERIINKRRPDDHVAYESHSPITFQLFYLHTVHKILSCFLYIVSFPSHEPRYIEMGANTYQGILPAFRLIAQSTNLQRSASFLLAQFYPPH